MTWKNELRHRTFPDISLKNAGTMLLINQRGVSVKTQNNTSGALKVNKPSILKLHRDQYVKKFFLALKHEFGRRNFLGSFLPGVWHRWQKSCQNSHFNSAMTSNHQHSFSPRLVGNRMYVIFWVQHPRILVSIPLLAALDVSTRSSWRHLRPVYRSGETVSGTIHLIPQLRRYYWRQNLQPWYVEVKSCCSTALKFSEHPFNVILSVVFSYLLWTKQGEVDIDVDDIIARLLEGTMHALSQWVRSTNYAASAPLCLVPLCEAYHSGKKAYAVVVLCFDFFAMYIVRGCRPGKTVGLLESEITALCVNSREIFMDEPMLVEVPAPVMVFGDIHGQYYDLLRWVYFVFSFPMAVLQYTFRLFHTLSTVLFVKHNRDSRQFCLWITDLYCFRCSFAVSAAGNNHIAPIGCFTKLEDLRRIPADFCF